MSADHRICAACVGDAFLKDEIEKSVVVNEACHYCASIRATVGLGSLADRCNTVIQQFYEVSSLTNAVVIYDREPDGAPLLDVLDQILEPTNEVLEDLAALLEDQWFDFDTQQSQFGEEPWFVEKSKCAEPLNTLWESMEDSLRNEARFINPAAARVLETVFGPILNDRGRTGSPVVVEVGPGGAMDTVFRARVFQSMSVMHDALAHPERHIGSRPQGSGPPGRMNAKGVSVFYGSTDKDIAIAEVRPPVGSHVVVALFKIVRKLRLLDLHELGSISLKPGSSYFDPLTFDQAARRDFLEILTQRVVMPVMPEMEEQGYLITQAIADFLSTHPTLGLDGILFPSAQDTSPSIKTSARNVILFNKAAAVGNAERNMGKTTVNLYEFDEDSSWFEPEIWSSPPETDDFPDLPDWGDRKQRVPSLELDRNAIEIHYISGVTYMKNTYPVKHRVFNPKK